MNSSVSPTGLDPDRLQLIERFAHGLDPLGLTWASGYLAGLARAQQPAAPAMPSGETRAESHARATVLYASQTGNGRRIAERLARTAEATGLSVRLLGAAEYPLRELAAERLLFVVVSTHGDGDPPDDARALFEHLASRRAQRLDRLAYSVLALGDSSYPKFCESGRQLDERLGTLGARRLAPRQDCDVDYESEAQAWLERSIAQAREQLAEVGAPRLALVTPLRPLPTEATRERPLEVEIIANQRLTGRDSLRDIRHIEFSLTGGRLDYEPGDALGIAHRNPDDVVARVIDLTGLDGSELVTHEGRGQSLATWLEAEREITRLSRSFLEVHARRARQPQLAEALLPTGSAQLRGLLKDWQVADLLRRYPTQWSASELVAALRPLTPRLYSIASSRLTVGDEAHLTVARVDYHHDGQRRSGAASSFLASQLLEGSRVRAYVESNPRFRLPADGDRDVIMIGPGTGVAPFRAFVQHREATSARGRNWLFFGARHFESEFLYQTEWLAAQRRGSLQRIDVAFSRDQPRRVYVQQRMVEQGAELYAWLAGGAHLYVCGDSASMAPDVHATLIDIVRVHGGLEQETARAYVEAMLTERRYARDVY